MNIKKSIAFTDVSPHPLFGPYSSFIKLGRNEKFSDEYSSVKNFIESLSVQESMDDYKNVRSFLYSKCRSSEGTYNSVRIDIERLLLWSWLHKGVSIVMLKRSDIEDYVDFVYSPPSQWIKKGSNKRFMMLLGSLSPNLEWCPFSLPLDSDNYSIKSDTLKQMFANLSSLYEYLVEDDYALGNLIPSVRSSCVYLVKNKITQTVLRLSPDQWDFLLESITARADEDSGYERALFIIVTMKVLYLRVSELCDRPAHKPTMGDFKNRSEGRFLYVFGKGKKERPVSIPDDYLPYLARYRSYLGLSSSWPAENESTPMLCSFNGKLGNITARQLRRIISEAFDFTCQELVTLGNVEDSEKLRQATTHWLRHTGASMDIEADRPLKHVSEELGHASMTFTDAVYVQSDLKERISSGRKRSI